MSKKVSVRLKPKGIIELLKSDEITAATREACEKVRDRSGSGYSMNMQEGKKRAVGRVYAYTSEAVRDNYKNNTLLKALHK